MASGSNTPRPIVRRIEGRDIIFCPHPGCDRKFAKLANYVSHSSAYSNLGVFQDSARQSGGISEQFKGSTCTGRTHTGETPYSCEICGLQFRWQSSQKAHMKSHERRHQRQSSSQSVPAASEGDSSTRQAPQHDRQTILPAIHTSQPHSAPRVEPLEPPVTPASRPRRLTHTTPPCPPLGHPPSAQQPARHQPGSQAISGPSVTPRRLLPSPAAHAPPPPPNPLVAPLPPVPPVAPPSSLSSASLHGSSPNIPPASGGSSDPRSGSNSGTSLPSHRHGVSSRHRHSKHSRSSQR